MKISGTINQIRPQWDGNSERLMQALLNVGGYGPGGIGVQASMSGNAPIYLLKHCGVGVIAFVQFNSQSWADDWLEENEEAWEVVEQLHKERMTDDRRRTCPSPHPRGTGLGRTGAAAN